jgi:pyrimidine operon attenuation protein/uracil phosphoribosyltransferase
VDNKELNVLAKKYLPMIRNADKKIKAFFSGMQDHEVIIVDDLLLRIMAHTIMEFVEDHPVLNSISELDKRKGKFVITFIDDIGDVTRDGSTIHAALSEINKASAEFKMGVPDDKASKKD